MISAISWVPKGATKLVPEVAEPPSKEEIEEVLKSGRLGISETSDSEGDDEGMDLDPTKQADVEAHALAAADALEKTTKTTTSRSGFDDITDGLAVLDMEKYDEEDDGIELFSTGFGDLYYPDNEADPYLKDKDGDDSEDLEDDIIRPTDSVIVCARNEDDVSHIEVWVYDDSNGDGSNMYVHHDFMVPAFPLCTAWLDCPLKGGDGGNFLAVGSMKPAIEIWDLDTIEAVQPFVILGGVVEKEKNKKKKKKKKKGKKTSVKIKYKEDSHTSSVLGLAWNKVYRNILASASADKLVKIWDVATGKCRATMAHHTNKVQTVAWNHYEPQILLSGSFDHSVVMVDGRIPSHAPYKWSVSADVESLEWDPHTNHSFVVSLEDGTVRGYDIRNTTIAVASESKPSFTLHAHDKAVCTVSYNSLVPNLLATGSMDKMVKLWDLSNDQPSCIASKNPKAGAVFSVSFSEECPRMLAIGGSKGKLELWDILSDAGVARRFVRLNNQNFPPQSDLGSLNNQNRPLQSDLDDMN